MSLPPIAGHPGLTIIVLVFICFIAFLLWLSFINYQRRKELGEGYPMIGAGAGTGVMHPPSFSLLLFRGDVVDELPSLITEAGYRVSSTREIEGAFEAVYSEVRLEGGAVTRKGVYETPGFTAFMDPDWKIQEKKEVLKRFCRKVGSDAVTAVWSRETGSVIYGLLDGDGVKERLALIQGRAPVIEPLFLCSGVHRELHSVPTRRSPDPSILTSLIRRHGLDPTILFGEIECVVLEVESLPKVNGE